jgi:methionyl-tRNA formyltransferase
MKKSVIILGKGTLAIRIAEWFRDSLEYQIHCVVPVIPEPTWTNSLVQWCEENGVRYVPSGHYRYIPCVGADNFGVDLAISVFYDKIIRPWFINKCRRSLNLHNGPFLNTGV